MNMQTRTAPRTRREKNAEASRKAILDAALVEFSTQGFDGARVDTIAARAFEVWERKGKPEGQDHANWKQAEAELLAEAGLA